MSSFYIVTFILNMDDDHLPLTREWYGGWSHHYFLACKQGLHEVMQVLFF